MRKELEAIQVSRPRARRSFLTSAVAGLVFGCLPLAATTLAQKQEGINTATIQHSEKFQGGATLLDKGGKPRMVRASVHQWTILGDQLIPEFQEHGFLLVQLLGGKVTTVIEGKEQKRSSGEFWVVPANARMSIHATGETATLEVTVLSIS
jgi:quercetin dioxygenase-like cupin family protein